VPGWVGTLAFCSSRFSFASVLSDVPFSPCEPFAYVRELLIALSAADVDLRSLLPDIWIAAHPEHFLEYRRDEAEAAARARKRRREKRRVESKVRLRGLKSSIALS
jgi:hypothetical protein